MSSLPTKILKEALNNCKLAIEDLRIFLPRTSEAQATFDTICKWNKETMPPQYFIANHDFRIRHLLLKNFRKFGNLPDHVYYGLQFEVSSDKNESKLIDFLTLLGDNGVGKSSLVDSLEYMFTGNISEAKIRQIIPTTYIKNRSGEKSVKVNLANGLIFDLNDDSYKNKTFIEEYDVTNFFFSENSILKFAEYTQRNGDNSNNWFPFFCYMLGLGALYEACNNDGILNQIKQEVYDTIQELSEDVNQTRKKLQDLLRDGSYKITESQRKALYQLRSKLLEVKQDIKEDKIGDDKMQGIFDKTDFYNLTSFYFIQDFQKIYKTITAQTTFSSSLQGARSKKLILEEKKSEDGSINKLLDAIEECSSHIENVLNNGTGIVSLDTIKKDVLMLVHKEQVELIVERHKTSKELDILASKIDSLKENLLNLIHKTVVDYVDESLVKAIKSIFDETFITVGEENFVFDISGLKETNKISISINEEPVHKYFNTFRYRLFCLTLQAVLNIKLMKGEDFLFPFILDDVFYANDYRNKRELFKYFEQIRQYARETLEKEQNLQIIFFTHDEQIVSCFSTKFSGSNDGKTTFARLTLPKFAEKFECEKITLNGNEEKYHNLYFKLYE